MNIWIVVGLIVAVLEGFVMVVVVSYLVQAHRQGKEKSPRRYKVGDRVRMKLDDDPEFNNQEGVIVMANYEDNSVDCEFGIYFDKPLLNRTELYWGEDDFERI